ncbi:short chain dehydrogenase/reductase [Podospora didyma]|uniref:Short chain dehydrogenase/reductase n=1 Tax=Podospora didyma TaxID=330526 RepID=A0AAE0P3E6_9PEZI|nr:short chain dehydrogenase/reductase [Podospora didyma]
MAHGSLLSSILVWLGVLSLISYVIGILDALYVYLQPSQLHRYLHPDKNGRPAWALVTGASDGIGRAFSFELAARGFNVVLHGRNQAKLDGVRQELLARHGPSQEFRILIADAKDCSQETLAKITRQLADINLTVLVNNAGGAPESKTFGTLDEYSNRQVTETVHVNALFPTLLLGELMPMLARNAPSLALSVGSVTDHGLPLLSFYGASKAFFWVIATSAARENKMVQRDIEVLHLRIGLVTGVAAVQQPPTLFVPHASHLAKVALARVGCGRIVVTPYWGHLVQAESMAMLPEWVQAIFYVHALKDLQENGMNSGLVASKK